MLNILDTTLVDVTRQIVLDGFKPRYGQLQGEFQVHPLWRRLEEVGSRLWLDTGDMEGAGELWNRSFSALTTNNTLLNHEVQRGTYDGVIIRSASMLRKAVERISDEELIQEIAFILNAYHALRLVEKFDARVSVELHTDLANDASGSVAYGRRLYQICPERFLIKVPLTAEGLVAAARLGREGIPVNFTLGFSARQNLMICLLSRPVYCNVFLGRLNQVVADNHLGDGQWVGERAIAASQAMVSRLRRQQDIHTLQIAASLRSGKQIESLAGVDVLTMPPKAAREFQDSGLSPKEVRKGIDDNFRPAFGMGISPGAYAVDTLWEVPSGLAASIEQIAKRDATSLTGMDIQEMMADIGFGDLLPFWSDQDIRRASQDGKIPKLALWRDRLATGEIGLDSLMTLSALYSFTADQQAMDERIREHLSI